MISNGKNNGNVNSPHRNSEGYLDPTVCDALKEVQDDATVDHELFCKLMKTINSICELAGFRIQGRFAVRSTRTGKVFMKAD